MHRFCLTICSQTVIDSGGQGGQIRRPLLSSSPPQPEPQPRLAEAPSAPAGRGGWPGLAGQGTRSGRTRQESCLSYQQMPLFARLASRNYDRRCLAFITHTRTHTYTHTYITHSLIQKGLHIHPVPFLLAERRLVLLSRFPLLLLLPHITFPPQPSSSGSACSHLLLPCNLPTRGNHCGCLFSAQQAHAYMQ